MRRLVAVLAALVVLGLTPPASGDAFVDEQYGVTGPPSPGGPGWISGYFDDSISDVTQTAVLWGFRRTAEVDGFDELELCSSIKDPKCEKLPSFDFLTFLKPCTAEVATDCIVDVAALRESETVQGIYQREFPRVGSADFEGDSTIGLPGGESPSLWRFPGVRHEAGEDFLVAASLKGGVESGSPFVSQMRLSIFPVSVVERSGIRRMIHATAPLANGRLNMSFGGGGSEAFIFTDEGEGLLRWGFPQDVRFRLTIRTRQPLVGWMHGRVQEPDVALTTGTFGQQFTVTAAPTVVPVLDRWTRFTALPAGLQEILRRERPSGQLFYGASNLGDWDQVSYSYQNSGRATDDVFQKFLYFVQAADDRAAANKSSWTVRTITGQELGGTSQCLQSTRSLAGVVSTNATVYLAGPPRFDASTQTLNYRVAAPHYARDGSLNIGHYSLIMRSEVARCIYGFRNAPISASISVVSAEGAPQVATTVVSQKDGWLNLRAGGFTYSSPTVQVRLSQEPERVVVAPPVRTPVASVKRTTITCAKGSQVRQVRAVKPRCPAGWQRRGR